jgi:lysophospholipase L1-like esterase
LLRLRSRILLTILLGASASFLALDYLAAQVIKRQAALSWREAMTASKARERDFRSQSELFHHALRPNRSALSSWGGREYLVVTNALGLRDRTKREVSKIPKARRILFLGDSFTEAIGIEYDRSFVGLVDQELHPQGVEVLNGGVASYSPTIYLRRAQYLLESMGLEVDEIIVFVDVSDAQDDALYYRLDEANTVKRRCDKVATILEIDRQVRHDVRRFFEDFDADRPEQIKEKWRAGSWDEIATCEDEYRTALEQLPFRIRFADHWRFNSVVFQTLNGVYNDWIVGHQPNDLFARDSHSGVRALWSADEELFNSYGRDGSARMTENMDKVLSLAKKHRAKLTLAIYPWPHQLAKPKPDHYRSLWQRWSRERGVELIDYYSDFTREPPSMVYAKYFIQGDVHWNRMGHEIIAKRFTRTYLARER